MIARTTPETHNPRISAQSVTHRLRGVGERPPYTMYVLYAAFLFWPSLLLSHFAYICMSTFPSHWHANQLFFDRYWFAERLSSRLCYQIVKILTTLEPYGIFKLWVCRASFRPVLVF